MMAADGEKADEESPMMEDENKDDDASDDK